MYLSEHRAKSYHKCYWLSDPLLTQWIAYHLKPFGTSLCEVGAGTGNMANSLMRQFSRLYLLEPSPSMVGFLRRRVRRMPPVTVIRAVAENIPLMDGSVDVALAKSSFHHFKDQQLALREMARIASRALAIIEVVGPDAQSLSFARDLLLRKEGRGPLSVFAEEDLVALIRPFCSQYRGLHFDQYIDVQTWLENSDLSQTEQAELYRYTLSQASTVSHSMQIHRRAGRLVQLRRMLLLIGIIG